MFELGLIRSFKARHYLIGGDWGRENTEHEHSYRVEWIVRSAAIDKHQYVADLLRIEDLLERTLACYKDKLLNELPLFSGKNPSIELFARILWQELFTPLRGSGIVGGTVRLWENADAWASWEDSF